MSGCSYTVARAFHMNSSDQQLLDAYLELGALPEKSARREQLFWAFEEICDLVRKDPERLWRLIVAASKRKLEPEVAAFFAAGAVEDLLVEHGARFIDAVEKEARVNPAFNSLLGGVWLSGVEPSVKVRVEAVRLEVW